MGAASVGNGNGVGLGNNASAIRVSEFSRQAGINQEAIYEGLSPGGDPTLEKLAK